MKKQTLVKVRKELPVDTNKTPADLIGQAIAKGANLETLERLLTLKERFEANEAKKAYYKAMSLFKANIPQINKNKKVNYPAGGGSVKYSYATLFNAIDKVTPKLSEFGLSVAWFHKQTKEELTVTCRITHELGYSEETSLTGPHDNTGSKNAIQALGSTNSYLERYTFFALIGTAAKDQDDDGMASGPVELIDDKQKSQLVDCLTVLKKTEGSFCRLLKVESLDKLPKTRYQQAMSIIKSEAERTGVKL